jgi:hypothetical protein
VAADPRWRIVRVIPPLPPHEDPAVVVQFVLPKPIWLKLVEALDLAARLTGSERLGAQVDVLCAEATTEWLKTR